MKTQTFGWAAFTYKDYIFMLSVMGHPTLRERVRDLFAAHKKKQSNWTISYLKAAYSGYREARTNGLPEDAPIRNLPLDGTASWEKKEDGHYDYVKYVEGPGDKEWMEQCDRNYVFRLEREGRLDQIEANLNTEMPKLYEEVIAYRVEQKLEIEQKEKESQDGFAQKQVEQETFDPSYLIPYTGLKIGRELGEGEFGHTYEGIWQHEPVAIKQLSIEPLSHNALEEFKSEMAVMIQVHHPRIVTLFGVSLDRSGHYSLVMEYMPKNSLYSVLHNRHEQLDWGLRYRISMDICVGLLHLHDQNILHRNLKSMNVLLDDRMRAKLSDFGLAKIRDKSIATDTTRVGGFAVGTIPWMAPELFKSRSRCTKASDIYSLGIIFWEIASRLIPYSDAVDSKQIVLWKEDEQGVAEIMPKDCPARYSALIQWCWKDQNKRPKIDELVVHLTLILKTIDLPENNSPQPENSQLLITEISKCFCMNIC